MHVVRPEHEANGFGHWVQQTVRVCAMFLEFYGPELISGAESDITAVSLATCSI
jgi:hypothetical protein